MENALFWMLVAAYAAHILEEYVLDWRARAGELSGMRLDWAIFCNQKSDQEREGEQ